MDLSITPVFYSFHQIKTLLLKGWHLTIPTGFRLREGSELCL